MEINDEVLDAIAVLTGLTAGDVFYKIQDGKFEEIASEALYNFSKNYVIIERERDVKPIREITILEKCLEDLEKEILQKEGVDDPEVQKEVQILKHDAEGFRTRIAIAKEGFNE